MLLEDPSPASYKLREKTKDNINVIKLICSICFSTLNRSTYGRSLSCTAVPVHTDLIVPKFKYNYDASKHRDCFVFCLIFSLTSILGVAMGTQALSDDDKSYAASAPSVANSQVPLHVNSLLFLFLFYGLLLT